FEIGAAPDDAKDKAVAGRSFRTKGDADEDPDPWRMVLNHPTQDRVEQHLLYVGYVYIWLSERRVQLLVIGDPRRACALARGRPRRSRTTRCEGGRGARYSPWAAASMKGTGSPSRPDRPQWRSAH